MRRSGSRVQDVIGPERDRAVATPAGVAGHLVDQPAADATAAGLRLHQHRPQLRGRLVLVHAHDRADALAAVAELVEQAISRRRRSRAPGRGSGPVPARLRGRAAGRRPRGPTRAWRRGGRCGSRRSRRRRRTGRRAP